MPYCKNICHQFIFSQYTVLSSLFQQNFSVYFMIFFYNYFINFYLLSAQNQWKQLMFLTPEIALFSFIISTAICDPIGKYRRLFIFAFFAFIICFNILCFSRHGIPINPTTLATSFIIFTLFFRMKSNTLRHIIIILFGLIWLIDIFSLFIYKTPMNSTMITFILETNHWEIYEYVMTTINMPTIFLLFIIFMINYLIYKYLRLPEHYRAFATKILTVLLPIGVFVTIVPCFDIDYTNNFKETIPVVRFYTSTTDAIERRSAYEDFSKQDETSNTITENNAKIKNIVIILGESASKNHMGIYGYQLNTTPYAEKLVQSGNLSVFRDVISPYETTTYSMSTLFTFSNYEHEDDPSYLHENLIDIMKNAGYKTYWLSNQEFSSLFGNIEMHLSKRSDMKMFTRYRGSEEMNLAAYDEELLPLLDQSLQDDADKKFIVIHLMGSHYTYTYRYPEKYNVFQASDIRLERSFDKKQIIAEYDNSILYSDYIIDAIFTKLQHEETLIFYLSDHGEDVFESRDRIVRSNGTVNKHTVEIPFFILATDSFKHMYPNKIEQINSALDRRYMADDFIHTVLDLAEIKTERYEETRSIVNSSFDAARKRMTCKKDYDTELK